MTKNIETGNTEQNYRQNGHTIPHLPILAAGLCISAALFCLLLAAVLTGSAEGFDAPVREAFYAIRSSGLTAFAVVITNLSNKYFIIGGCLLLLIIPKTRISYGIPVSAGALGTIILNHFIKDVVERIRPDVMMHLVTETGYSFPSGHSINSMFCYGIMIWLVRTNVKNERTANILTVLLAVPMILVGLSRIYLGVHHPTDVLAGWCLGLFSICAVILIMEWIRGRRSAQPISTLPGARSK